MTELADSEVRTLHEPLADEHRAGTIHDVALSPAGRPSLRKRSLRTRGTLVDPLGDRRLGAGHMPLSTAAPQDDVRSVTALDEIPGRARACAPR